VQLGHRDIEDRIAREDIEYTDELVNLEPPEGRRGSPNPRCETFPSPKTIRSRAENRADSRFLTRLLNRADTARPGHDTHNGNAAFRMLSRERPNNPNP